MIRQASLLVAPLLLLLAGAVSAQSDYTFTAPSIIVPEGATGVAVIELDSLTGGDVQGWSFGLCSEPTVVEVTGTAFGATAQALGGGAGPDFWQVDVFPDGISLGSVVSFLGMETLPPASDHEIIEVEYLGVGISGDTTPLDFCSLGMAAPVVVVGGVGITPDMVSGEVEIVNPFDALLRLDPSAPELNPGGTFSATVELDNPVIVEGFEFGVSHDGAQLTALSVDEGAATLAAGGGAGPDSFIVDLTPGGGTGVTVSCVVDTDPMDSIPVGSGQPIAVINYDVNPTAGPACSETELTFSSGLGVPISVTTGGSAGFASAISLEVEIGVPILAPPTGGQTLSVLSAVGAAGDTVPVSIVIDTDEAIAGFSFGVAHDESFASVTGVPQGNGLVGISCGSGPDFYEWQSVPGGLVVGCVIDFSGPSSGSAIPASSQFELVRVNYLIDGAGTGTSIDLVSTLGNPSVPVELSSVDGLAIVPDTEPGALTTGTGFSRGDCNDDGLRDLGDAVFTLNALFSGTADPTCDDACDSNDDGGFDVADGIYLLNSLFVPGSPGVPSPVGCGGDPTADSLDCEVHTSCL